MAHFRGTVGAYEALHAHPGLHLYLLVTLGSPLALPGAIFDRRQPGQRLQHGGAAAGRCRSPARPRYPLPSTGRGRRDLPPGDQLPRAGHGAAACCCSSAAC